MPIVLKSGNLCFLEPSGPVQACNGVALPLPLPFIGLYSNKIHGGIHYLFIEDVFNDADSSVYSISSIHCSHDTGQVVDIDTGHRHITSGELHVLIQISQPGRIENFHVLLTLGSETVISVMCST